MDMSKIAQTKQIVVNWVMSLAGTANPNFNLNIPNLNFEPDLIILRKQLVSAGTENLLLYNVRSNLTNGEIIATFSGRNQMSNPDNIIKPLRPCDMLTFQVTNVANTGVEGSVGTTMNNDWYLSLVFDFVQLKKGNGKVNTFEN